MNNIKFLYIRTNEYCNAHCFMCDFWKNIGTEITEEQFENTLNIVKNVEIIRFTGGEPLLCKKITQYGMVIIQHYNFLQDKTSIPIALQRLL